MAKLVLLSADGSAVGSGADADMLIRTTLFIATFLSVWISFHPFQSLAEPPPELTDAGDLANQIGFSTVFLVLAAWTSFNEPRRLKLIMRPALIAAVIWCVVSVVTSWEPSLAARRLAFALMLMSISGMILLLPKTLRHFSDLMAAVALIVLVVCYLGVFFAPSLSIHQATDFLEPDHPGNWRGVFPHKNEAGAMMVLFIFIGLFVARMRSLGLGALIVVLASVFLAFTQSKTAIGVLPLALTLSAVIGRSRSPAMGVALVVTVLAVFNLSSVGTVLFEPVRNLIEAIMPDATFTGRTEIWQLALQAVAQRPVTGYGFMAFWGSEQVVYGMGEKTTWVNTATDAHNAYLNVALGIGIPGLALVIAWIVILPILDFYRRPRTVLTSPLEMLFLRVCLYGIYAACFESSFFKPVGEVWFLFMTAAFGLRYLSVTRVVA